MISSKALIDETSISRATLNNYIQLGILPKPLVQSIASDLDEGGARILGYFPDDAPERVRAVQVLKGRGLSIAQVAERLAQTDSLLDVKEIDEGASNGIRIKENERQVKAGHHQASKGLQNLSISVDNLIHPAYMFNYNFELSWLNESARKEVFGFESPPDKGAERNLCSLISQAKGCLDSQQSITLLTLLMKFFKSNMGHDALMKIIEQGAIDLLDYLDVINSDQVDQEGVISEAQFSAKNSLGEITRYRIFAVYFREGVLIVHFPEAEERNDLLNFLSHRDRVIQSLLSQRLPVLTSLAVLVADLQNSVNICSELPPDEYFALINQIWAAMGKILSKYAGTHGKHMGDGVVYYFFPKNESNYLFNAVICSVELRSAMREISAQWQLKKNWTRELQLNIGLHEGQEWLGGFQSANHIEFVALGNTINEATRLSDFARLGRIWATKSLVSKLSVEERNLLDFGVMIKSAENGDRFLSSTYSQIQSLADLNQGQYEKIRDIGQLAITQIRDVRKVVSTQY
jgi:class 3 adenylate cyclase